MTKPKDIGSQPPAFTWKIMVNVPAAHTGYTVTLYRGFKHNQCCLLMMPFSEMVKNSW